MARPFLISAGTGRATPLTFDERYRLRNTNPFAPVTTLIGSPATQVAPTFADLGNAAAWEEQQVARAMRPPGGGLSLFAGPTPNNLIPENPFTVLRNTKNPGIQSAVDAILGRVSSLNTDPRVNTNVVRSNVKDQPTATRIGAAGQRFDVDVNDVRQSIADFAKKYASGQPRAEEFFEQEAGAIGQVYDRGPGGVQARLDTMSDARQRAITAAAQRAMQAALARTNSGRMLTGDSGYLDALLANAAGGINAQATREKFDLDRSNLLAVLDAQMRLGGQRGRLQDSVLSRGLLPIQLQQAQGGNELAQLAGLTNLQNANTFYQVDNPEQMLARQLALLGDTSRLDLANNFYGLQRPYEPDASGLLPIGGFPRGGGGGFDFPFIDMFDDGTGTYAPGPRGATTPGARNPMVDAARNAYLMQTGIDPASDPNFSRESWDAIIRQFQPQARAPVRSLTDYSSIYEFPELNPNAVNEHLSRYYEFPERFFGGN